MSRSWILMATLVCIATALRLHNLGTVNSRSPDERVYTYQAKAWLDSGPSGLRGLIQEYRGDAETRLYPPPTRVGMIRLIATVMKFSGVYDERAGARISGAASLGSLIVLAVVGMRFVPPWAALAGMLFYSIFPADLAISRRTWTDALVELAGLLLIWFTCEITRNPQRRFWYILFAFTGGAGLLVKESIPVPYALCGFWILWILIPRKRWTELSIGLAATVLAFGVSLAWLSQQVGGFSIYYGIVTGIPEVNATNAYALEYASGPAYLMLLAFWIIAPVTSLFALGGIGVVCTTKREPPLIFLTAFSLTFLAIAMAMPHWINLRYVGNIYGSFCLLAGLGVWYLVSVGGQWLETSDRRPFVVITIAIVLGSAAADYLRFQRYFVRDELIDLSIKMLVDEHNQ